jgi:hypothetical protein
VENPYFQYFTGEEYFRHELPHDRSSMARGRVSEKELACLLQESLRIAHKTGALRIKDPEAGNDRHHRAAPRPSPSLPTPSCSTGPR